MYVSWCYIFFVILLTGTTHYDETFPSRRQHRPCRCVDFRLMQSLSYPSEGKRKHGNTSTRYLPPNRKGGPRKGARSGTGRLSAEHSDPERLTVLPIRPAKPYRHELHRVQPRLHRIHLALAIFQLYARHGGNTFAIRSEAPDSFQCAGIELSVQGPYPASFL